VQLAFKVARPCSGVSCVIALDFIFLCVGLMTIFCGVKFFSDFLSSGVYFSVSQSWCGVSRLLVEFLRVQVLPPSPSLGSRTRNRMQTPKIKINYLKLKLSHDRQSVCPGFRPQTWSVTKLSFSLKFCLVCCRFVILWRPIWPEDGSAIYCCCLSSPVQSLGTHGNNLLSQFFRLPEPRGPGPRIPRNSVSHLYPRAQGSLFVTSYDLQGYGGDILTRLHTRNIFCHIFKGYVSCFMSWLFSEFRLRGFSIYLVFSVFTSRPLY
jgi:hypothetical protein